MSAATLPARETVIAFACFGASCGVRVLDGEAGAAERARALLLDWHARFTRFDARSELARMNSERTRSVPVSTPMARFVTAALGAAEATGGLVDPTLLRPLEELGYRGERRHPLPLALALRLAPPRKPAAPADPADWRTIEVDARRRVITRPPGVALDGGGIVKGLAADAIAGTLRGAGAYVVECAGDLRVGGCARRRRPVRVASPFDGRVLHVFELADAGVATSGIGRRSWLDARARPAHHLLDPSTRLPAFTGVVQATAIAPTALEAEVRAKAALLAGPAHGPAWLPHGGVLVLDDGRHRVIEPGGMP